MWAKLISLSSGLLYKAEFLLVFNSAKKTQILFVNTNEKTGLLKRKNYLHMPNNCLTTQSPGFSALFLQSFLNFFRTYFLRIAEGTFETLINSELLSRRLWMSVDRARVTLILVMTLTYLESCSKMSFTKVTTKRLKMN